ncbi:MAG TPA: response regulator [Flavobacteriales bacterium]|nr:response regulator [Flavobacteriales bacterium]HMR26144.1 response regulator [Flavobacteriales bacterium]
MDALHLVIVEDDAVIAADLAALLHDLGHRIAATCPDATTALQAIAVHRPDLVLLDINLGQGRDGVHVADHLNAVEQVPFVFITGHTDQRTLDRVKATRPAGFIIKPFDEDDLRTQIEIAVARHAAQVDVGTHPGGDRQGSRNAEVLFVRDKGRLAKVPVQEIRFVEADNNYVVIHTADRRYVLARSLNSMEEHLASSHFVRIHRRYLVDVRRITALREREALLGDVVLPVGKTHKEALRLRWEQR